MGRTMMKRFFQKWLREILGDWQVGTSQKCMQTMIVFTTRKRDMSLDIVLVRYIFLFWKRIVWLEICEKCIQLDREEMRTRYSMRKWGRHEENLSPKNKR